MSSFVCGSVVSNGNLLRLSMGEPYQAIEQRLSQSLSVKHGRCIQGSYGTRQNISTFVTRY